MLVVAARIWACVVDIAKQANNPSTSEGLAVGSVQEPCLLWRSHGAHLMVVERLMLDGASASTEGGECIQPSVVQRTSAAATLRGTLRPR